MKKLLSLSLAVCLMFCVSGCRFFKNDFSSLLVAPEAPSELNKIQNALSESINGEYTLQYPTEGIYRSAAVQYDLDRDSLRETFALYSTENDDGTQTMHLSFICYSDEKWTVKNNLQIVATGVRFIDFYDLNNDGIYEVVVGWENYNSSSGTLAVYCLENGNLVQRVQEEYLAYLIYDADEDHNQELLIVNAQRPQASNITNVDNKEQKAVMTASLYKLEKNEIRQVGRCGLDSAPEHYAKPQYASISKGQKAVILDGYIADSGMITEAIVWKDGALSSLFYDAVTGQNTITFRTSNIRSYDYNYDGIVEIPQMQQLPTPAEETADSVYLTKWTQMTDEGLASVGYAIVNTVDGYYIDIPAELNGKITIVRKTDTMQRIVYMWDAKNYQLADEIFRVQLFPIAEWKEQGEWIELKRDDKYVYAGMINKDADLSISIEQLENGLHLISSLN